MRNEYNRNGSADHLAWTLADEYGVDKETMRSRLGVLAKDAGYSGVSEMVAKAIEKTERNDRTNQQYITLNGKNYRLMPVA